MTHNEWKQAFVLSQDPDDNARAFRAAREGMISIQDVRDAVWKLVSHCDDIRDVGYEKAKADVLAVVEALGTGVCQTCKDHAAIEKEHGPIVWNPHDCTGKAGAKTIGANDETCTDSTG